MTIFGCPHTEAVGLKNNQCMRNVLVKLHKNYKKKLLSSTLKSIKWSGKDHDIKKDVMKHI